MPDDDVDPEETLCLDDAAAIMGRLRFILGRGMSYITDAQNSELAAWQFSFAIGSDNCLGSTMSAKAQELGVTPACISKGATQICRMLGLPPSPYMLGEGARDSYRNLRRDQETQRAAHLTKEQK